MTRAQRRPQSPDRPTSGSIDPHEVEKFSAIAAEWWDSEGKFAPLHHFNPVRLAFIRNECGSRFERGFGGLEPFAGLSLLDIGCGGGLLCEPMARLGFAVTGVDASARNIAVAADHAKASGLSVDYRCSSAEALENAGSRFDVILNMEVIEHVADTEAFLRACANLLAPGGMMIVATINRTLKSLALAKIGAEYVLRWLPVGTHDWNRFVQPARLRSLIVQSGLDIATTQGVSFDPLSWTWKLSLDTNVNYMIVATKPSSHH
ncbi:MAG: bifunctional 2-polyprenyl-6-hydroxyphenol methylase/3-demethylubiquinol 3-O-methyltransferase UbiG [Rhizomicrobium sp.]|jgi:2-polyprenyl-6-hydroxyphenyl methylase/3-demethylubiquinone-9 3-methyltransferase